MIKLFYGRTVVLLGAAVVLVQPQVATGATDSLGIPINTYLTLASTIVAKALTPVEVNDIAKQITIRIDGSKPGSGVIVDQQVNQQKITYTVLTNWHVVKKKGSLTVQTHDGRSYQVDFSTVKRLPKVDLALLQFISNQTYRKAELGNSDQIREGMMVYAAGWIDSDRVCPERCYRFREGRISGLLPNGKDGYGLVYSNVIKPGMSGGPILDEQGLVVGINGEVLPDFITGAPDFFGIPIKTYLNLATAATSQLAASGERKYFCDATQGVPTIIARAVDGKNIPIIRWVSGSDSENKARCQEVSARFQRNYDNGTLNSIKTGTIQGQPAICAATSEQDASPCTDSTLLFRLKRGIDPQRILEKLLKARLLTVIVDL